MCTNKQRPRKRITESIKYFESVRDELLRLEEEIDKIKKSPEYIRNYRRLGIAKHQDQIDCVPSHKNGYRIPIVYSTNFLDEDFEEIEDEMSVPK